MNEDCDPVNQQARQDQLEALYYMDGRHDPAHPHHAVYTGLYFDLRLINDTPAN